MQIQNIADPRDGGDMIFTPVFNGNAADALVAGDCVQWELDSAIVAPEVAGRTVIDSTADDPLVAGVIIGAGFSGASFAIGTSGLMQVGGHCTTVTTDGSVTAGQLLVAAAAGVAKGSSTLVIGAFGVALATDSGTALTSAILRGNI